MLFFKSSEEKELECIVQKMEMNLSNNYKDNAQANLKELEAYLEGAESSHRLKEPLQKKYQAILEVYRQRLDGYSHKDQKPYWH